MKRDECRVKIDEGARRSIKLSPEKEIIGRPDGTLWLLQTASRKLVIRTEIEVAWCWLGVELVWWSRR
jgi:hypothetical protein